MFSSFSAQIYKFQTLCEFFSLIDVWFQFQFKLKFVSAWMWIEKEEWQNSIQIEFSLCQILSVYFRMTKVVGKRNFIGVGVNRDAVLSIPNIIPEVHKLITYSIQNQRKKSSKWNSIFFGNDRWQMKIPLEFRIQSLINLTVHTIIPLFIPSSSSQCVFDYELLCNTRSLSLYLACAPNKIIAKYVSCII